LTTIVALAVYILFHWWPIDGISGNLFAYISSEDTVYADDYNDDGFRSIHASMTRDQVNALIGQPLGSADDVPRQTREWWTRSPSDGDYRERAVVFEQVTVVEKIGQFWLD
jgi:hypothetical protein